MLIVTRKIEKYTAIAEETPIAPRLHGTSNLIS
jgi:hypothetical protein